MAMVAKMGGERERAFALWGEAKLLGDPVAKTETLKQLMEVLNREPALISELMPRILELQTDSSSIVLKYLAEIIEVVGEKSWDQIPIMVPTLIALLGDSTPAVARRAISSGTNLFRNTLELVALQGIYSGKVDLRLQDAWAWMTRFKEQVYPAAYHHGNDGVRLQAIKFVETTILLFTPDSNGSTRPPPQQLNPDGTSKGFNLGWITGRHPVLNVGDMGQEASKNLGLLLNQLRPSASSTLPGPVAIVLVNSLAAVAKRRPAMYGRVLPVLLGLAPNCESIKGGQVASVVHALKNAFLSLLKCTHSGAVPWRERLVTALQSMNAGEVAELTLRQVDRAMRNAERDRGSRDPRALKDEKLNQTTQSLDPSRKRALMPENGVQAGDSEGINGKRMRSIPNAGAAQSLARDGHMYEPTHSTTIESGLNPIQQMISMIVALLAQGDRAAASVELLISNIAPDMLADIVIANMTYLPSSTPSSQGGPNSERDSPASVSALGSLHSMNPGGQQRAQGPVVASGPGPDVAIPSLVIPSGANMVSEAATSSPAANDMRRDPRRDPRRLDPRRTSPGGSGSVVSPKDGDTAMGGAQVSALDPPLSGADIKQEPQGHVGVKDPRAGLQTASSAAPLSKKIKPEPMEEVPIRTENRSVSPVASASTARMSAEDPSRAVPSGATKQEDVEVSVSSSMTTGLAIREARTTSLTGSGLSTLTTGIPVNVPIPSLSVVALTDEQQVSLGKAALARILEGHKVIAAAGGDSLRIALLARLVAQSCEDHGAIAVLRKHILADYQTHMGHELALHVLYQLYAEQASEEGNDAALSPIAAAYESLLISLLATHTELLGRLTTRCAALYQAEGLRDSLPPTDKSLSKLLAEAPVLPIATLNLLQGLCNPQPVVKEGKEVAPGDRITQGLSALWSLILQRPPVRETCLGMALQCAVHEVEDIRAKAIRLVANKLYPLEYISKHVEDFALDKLRSVVQAPHESQPDDGAKDMDVDGGDGVEVHQENGIRAEEQANGDRKEDSGPDQAHVADISAQSSSKGSGIAFSIADAQRCMSLYFALCTKKHSLLRELFALYGSASKAVKQAVHRHVPVLFRTIGSSSPELLQIISDPPPGSENLLLQVLHSLTEGDSPSPDLIATVKRLYETKLQDAVFLIPVLSSLTKDEVLPIFPRLVDLPPEKFQTALARILQGSARTGPALTPTEVLIALHGIDPQRDSVVLKKVMDACSACLQQRTVFTQQVLAKVLNQLVEQTPLPLLFMRTVIQAVGAFPSLVSFVMETLSRLVNKQIWKFPKLWVGFLKCATQTIPHSLHVLLQLPPVQLEDAFTKHPALKAPLAAHASQPHVRSTVPRSSLVLLGLATPEESLLPPSLQEHLSQTDVQIKN